MAEDGQAVHLEALRSQQSATTPHAARDAWEKVIRSLLRTPNEERGDLWESRNALANQFRAEFLQAPVTPLSDDEAAASTDLVQGFEQGIMAIVKLQHRILGPGDPKDQPMEGVEAEEDMCHICFEDWKSAGPAIKPHSLRGHCPNPMYVPPPHPARAYMLMLLCLYGYSAVHHSFCAVSLLLAFEPSCFFVRRVCRHAQPVPPHHCCADALALSASHVWTNGLQRQTVTERQKGRLFAQLAIRPSFQWSEAHPRQHSRPVPGARQAAPLQPTPTARFGSA